MTDEIKFKNPITQLGWAKIDHVITFDPTLSDGAFRTYAMMIYHAQQDGETYVSLDTIANERDLRRETISIHTKELEDHGLITRIPRAGTSSITEIDELPKVYQDMAAVILNSRNDKKRKRLEKSNSEENLTGLLEKPNNTCEENLTRERTKESDIKNGAQAPVASELPSEEEIIAQDETQAEWDAMESASKTPVNLSAVDEALVLICDTDGLVPRYRFKKEQIKKLNGLLARDPTRAILDQTRMSFRQAIIGGRANAVADLFLGYYLTAIDTEKARENLMGTQPDSAPMTVVDTSKVVIR